MRKTYRFIFILTLFILPLLFSNNVYSQEDFDIESLYDTSENIRQKKQNKKQKIKSYKNDSVDQLSDLVGLSPFNDVAVIQRRFLPKSGRFEFTASGVLSINNAFFNNSGASLRAAYYFNSKFSLELMHFFLSSSQKDITNGLEDRSVKTTTLVTPKSFSGVAVRLSPIYGKMSLMNLAVVPFDISFSAGFGTTQTDFDTSAATLYFGSGQVFALSKRSAIRWDITLNSYAPKVASATAPSGFITQNQLDLFFSVGWSVFFPEATYR